ncbi:hypothetical protein ACS2QP_28245, partial [Bacillus cereus group sp. Bce019]|uniref:hypothetical protein n=1 Tax=Bacillus cereus group sp. Bce019 TaxID=3445247 RepID=UPI003F207310
ALRARHVALIPPQAARPAAAERLPEIAARAKIAAAGTRTEALRFLSQDETVALLASPTLLDEWAKLPQ